MPTKSVHKSAWKKSQSKSRRSKRIKLAVTVLGLLLLLILLSQVVRLTKTLLSPWNLSAKSTQSVNWDSDFNLNLLVRSKEVSLISLNPKEKKVAIINVPDETYLDVPHGFGKWQLRSIYQLGQSEEEGGKLLKESMADFFGLPIDGFLDLKAPYNKKTSRQIVDLLQSNPFSGFGMLASLNSDLTLWDLIRFKMALGSVRFDKVSEIDLSDLGVLEKTSLLDGSLVFEADPVKLDGALSDLTESSFVSEQKSIAIFNATDHPQLAQKAARLISNLGGHVIITSNASVRLKKTEVLGEKSETLKRLRQIFDASDTINPKDVDLEPSRAQINLFLGEDFAN